MLAADNRRVFSGDVNSYLFDGSGDYLTVPDHADWDFFGSSSGDYTISMFVKFTATPSGSQYFMSQRESNADRWAFYHNSSSGLNAALRTGNTNTIILSSGGTVISDTNWHHVVLCKVGSEYGLYLDGAQQGYVNDSSTDTFAAQLVIASNGGADSHFPGNTDEILVQQSNIFGAAPVVGTSDNITVPILQHTSDANTLLLIHSGEALTSGTTGSGAVFNDSGNTTHAVTEVDNAIRDTTTFKF